MSNVNINGSTFFIEHLHWRPCKDFENFSLDHTKMQLRNEIQAALCRRHKVSYGVPLSQINQFHLMLSDEGSTSTLRQGDTCT